MSTKTKIMIVDDNVTNLKLAGDLLEIEDFEVYRCLDGETAMKALDQFKPELILMDLALPGIDGLQLTHKLKSEEKTKDIKIVALTASAMKGDKEKILAAGCDGYIAKPIDTRKFQAQIIRYLQKETTEHTILVVDDTENNLKLSRAIFEIAGFKVITAEDGEQAFSILAEKKVDLVVTDILMPNIDGYLLCYTIKTSEKLKDVPIIIYSAIYTSSSDEAMAKEMGADKFIRRPASAEDLLSAARYLLSDARKKTYKILTKPKSIKATRLYNEGLVHKLEKRNLELEEARQDLEQSEMRLKEAQTIAHIGSWQIDMVHNTHRWSDELFDILGSKKEAAPPSSKLFLTFIHPDDSDFVSKVMQMSFVTLSDSSFEFRFIKNGAIRNGYSKYHFEFDKDHKPLRLAGIVQDITEKKLTDEALSAAHDRLLFHIENTPLGFIEWDNQLMLKAWSKRAEEIFGWSEAEFIDLQKTGFNQVYLEDQPSARKTEQQLMRGEVIRNRVQHRSYTKDGRVIWCEWFNSVLKDKEGEVATIMSLVQDITESKQAGQELITTSNALQKALNGLNKIMDSSLDVICAVDQEGYFLQVSAACETLWGYTANELIGKRLIDFVHPEDHESTISTSMDVIAGNNMTNFENRYIRKDGSLVPIVWSARWDATEKIRYGVARDATEKKKSETASREKLERLVAERTSELNEALKAEKELVEMKSKFVTIASHEFRTPLSTISFAAESIRNYFHKLTAEEIKAKLIKIEDQASHMTNLLEDILTLGKSEAGKIKVNRVSLDLRDFIHSLMEEVRATVKEKREINFTFSCSSNNVQADDRLLRNIVSNLLTNALKFSPRETPVTIAVSDFNGQVLIEVIDEGIGIPDGELESVFESFQRGSNAAEVQGTGLGLSILKKAVELMDGSVKVFSILKKGSTFSVRLPIQ